MRKTFSYITIATLLLLCACRGNRTNGSSDSDSTWTEETESNNDIIYLSCQFDTLIRMDMGLEDNPSISVHILAQYASGGKASVTDSINAGISDLIKTGCRDTDVRRCAQQCFDTFIKDYRDDITTTFDETGTYAQGMSYEYIHKGTFLSDSHPRCITYMTEGYCYSGGAHGGAWNGYANFWRNSGHKVKLTEILDMSRENEILDIMLDCFMEANDCSNIDEVMEKTGFLTLGDLYITDNFRLGIGNITFFYGQYDLAPYAAGMHEICVPYSKLGKILLI